ncbi:MAG: glycosyltransferase family 2 protein [Candidatus Aenigmarchaeota archaeon]|nr:glycosyltransferase family 2 protein [Candidatus Aenigmarchaeota archaeon]
MIEILYLAAILIDLVYVVMLVSMNLPPEKTVVKKLPKVSVIIASKDGTVVERALKQLKKVKNPKMEIIVVSSDAETLKVAKSYGTKIVRDRGAGKAAAVNSAVAAARCSILYFMDEDMIVRTDTIAKVCSGLNGYEVSVGYNMPENSGSLTARVARIYIAFLSKLQYGLYRLAGTTFVGGRNLAIYKQTLKRFGGFRDVLCEDIELSLRLLEKRVKVRFVNAVAYDQVPEKFSSYLKQQQRWNVGSGHALGSWEKKFHFHHISLLLFLLFLGLVAPLSLIFMIMAAIFGDWLLLSVPLLGFLLCLSSAISLGKRDLAVLPFTFFAFMVVHTHTIIHSKIRKPKGWYRTPKIIRKN